MQMYIFGYLQNSFDCKKKLYIVEVNYLAFKNKICNYIYKLSTEVEITSFFLYPYRRELAII